MIVERRNINYSRVVRRRRPTNSLLVLIFDIRSGETELWIMLAGNFFWFYHWNYSKKSYIAYEFECFVYHHIYNVIYVN